MRSRAGTRDEILGLEQRNVDFAYECYEAQLAGMSGEAAANASASGKDSVGVAQTAKRQAADYGGLGDEALVISHVDLQTEDGPETWYIGRRSVSDANSERVVLSWTSPLAEKWMTADPGAPGDIVLKRQLLCSRRTVEGYIDEIALAVDESAPGELPAPRRGEHEAAGEAGAEAEPPGHSADGQPATPARQAPTPGDIERRLRRRPVQPDELLLRELQRARGGRMRDIVETIRRDQMALVTVSPSDVLIVQGGPGTGKSAVGLHRVTWLISNRHFAATDVLVVGPHQRFLDYVGRVLPTLGTRDVAAVQLSRLWDGDIRGTEAREAAGVKSDERMAAVLHRRVERECRPEALDGLLTELAHSADKYFAVTVGSTVLRVPRAEMVGLVEGARAGGGAYRERRDRFRRLLVDRLIRELTAVAPRRGAEASMRRDLERNRQVERLIARVWGDLGPREALRTLYDSPELLRECAEGVLDEHESAVLHRPRAAKAEDEPWSAEDLVCLEELDLLITGRTPRRYGHIVIDEAQDLTPMQARSLCRRCAANGSMTVLGDLAQATGAHAYKDWGVLGALLSDHGDWRVAELRASYRIPAEIMAFVSPLAQVVAPGLPYPQAVREAGPDALRIVATPQERLVDEAVRHAARLAGTTDEKGTLRSVALIVADDGVGESVGRALALAGSGGDAVAVLSTAQAKGMEYDHVLVLEPAAIASEDDPTGLRRLYIALTRSTQSLTVVHAEPLPSALTTPADHDVSENSPRPEAAVVEADFPEIGSDLRVRVAAHVGGGRYRVEVLGSDNVRPVVLAVRSGSAPPRLGDELDVWVLRHESTITEVTADPRGRSPISDTMAERYVAALGVVADLADDAAAPHARTRLSELQGVANRCLRRDQHDWLEVWRLLGSPDKERLGRLRDLAARANRSLKAGAFDQAAFRREVRQSGWGEELAAAKAVLEGRLSRVPPNVPEPRPAVVVPSTREESDTVIVSSPDSATAPGTAARTELMALLASAVETERLCKTHEAVRHELLAALLRADLQPEFAPLADVICATAQGRVLYEVLGAEQTEYADLRSGAARLFEINHTLETPGERLCLVLADQPAQAWSADAVHHAFGIDVVWRTELGWCGVTGKTPWEADGLVT